MRTITAGQRTTIAANADIYAKLEVTNADGVWKDVSTSLSTPDWFNSCQITESIDSNTCSFSAELLRDAGGVLSLSPFRTDSTINVNSVPVYAPMLDLHRQWRVSVAVMGDGVAASGYKEIASGYVDSIDISDSRPTIVITGRGMEQPLLDSEILADKTYSVGSTASLEAVMQSIINTNWDVSYGAVPTIYVPVPTSFVINEYLQAKGNLMQALVALAEIRGAVFRSRYDATDVNRLTLYIPNRVATVANWTIASSEYLGLPLNRLDLTGVRNYIPVQYYDAGTKSVETVFSPIGGTSPSITSYGKRSMPIDLSGDTQISAAVRAQAFADAVRSDLELPSLQQRFETFGFWFVQLQDYGTLTANSVHYNTDQTGGVTAYTHTIANGTLRTVVDLGGKPKGGYASWRPLGQKRLPSLPGVPKEPVTPVLPPGEGTGPGKTGGCILWLRADTLKNSLLDGNTVAAWFDQSGNTNHGTSSAATNKPTFVTEGIAVTQPAAYPGVPFTYYEPAVHFANGAFISFVTGKFQSLLAAEIFIVMKRDISPPATSQTAGFWFLGGDVGVDGSVPATDGFIYDSFGATVRKSTGVLWNGGTNPQIYNVSSASGAWTNRLNGAQLYTTSTNTVGWNGTWARIGGGYPGGAIADQKYLGLFAEVICYDRVLTTAARASVYSYLGFKFGIGVV